MNIQNIINEFIIAISGKMVALGILTFLDLFFGVILAIRQGRFAWSKLTGYIDSDILPGLAWVAIEAIALIPKEAIPGNIELFIPHIVYGTVFLKIAASLAGHFAAIGVLKQPFEKAGIPATGSRAYREEEFRG